MNTHNQAQARPLARITEKGFSLVELLVVIIVIGGIMAMVLPNIIGTADRANWEGAKNQLTRLSQSVETFYFDVGRYPQSLQELVDKPGDAEFWSGPYVKAALLTDPWKRDWIYSVPGQKGEYEIATHAKDGAEGGDGVNRDLSNWD